MSRSCSSSISWYSAVKSASFCVSESVSPRKASFSAARGIAEDFRGIIGEHLDTVLFESGADASPVAGECGKGGDGFVGAAGVVGGGGVGQEESRAKKRGREEKPFAGWHGGV